MKKSHHGQKDKTHRGYDRMRRDTGSSAEGNDDDKVKEHGVIKKEIFTVFEMVPYQKTQVTGKDGKKYIKVKFIAFAPSIFREHTHPNHYIPYGGQDGNKYCEEPWVEK